MKGRPPPVAEGNVVDAIRDPSSLHHLASVHRTTWAAEPRGPVVPNPAARQVVTAWSGQSGGERLPSAGGRWAVVWSGLRQWGLLSERTWSRRADGSTTQSDQVLVARSLASQRPWIELGPVVPTASGSQPQDEGDTMTAAAATLVPPATRHGPEPGPGKQAAGEPGTPAGRHVLLEQVITGLILFAPLVGTVVATVSLFGRGVTTTDVVLAVTFYLLTGFGLTAGYHRLFSHRSFTPARWLKITLAVTGSLAFEGSPLGWVANHRRHHAFTDREGDPHSPYCYGKLPWSRARGAMHAHMGWLLEPQPLGNDRWVRDLRTDADLVTVSRLFPLFCVVSLGLPALIGWLVSGTLAAAVGGVVWGGLVRIFLLHQATFAVNSAGHIWGKRPYVTREADRSTNFAPLALLSLGDSWHNNHHSSPRLARHGVDRGQLDLTARLIWLFERFGAASAVHWPDPVALAARRKPLVVLAPKASEAARP